MGLATARQPRAFAQVRVKKSPRVHFSSASSQRYKNCQHHSFLKLCQGAVETANGFFFRLDRIADRPTANRGVSTYGAWERTPPAMACQSPRGPAVAQAPGNPPTLHGAQGASLPQCGHHPRGHEHVSSHPPLPTAPFHHWKEGGHGARRKSRVHLAPLTLDLKIRSDAFRYAERGGRLTVGVFWGRRWSCVEVESPRHNRVQKVLRRPRHGL